MSPSVLATLRDFVPIRALTREEAMRIAELQANRFREAVGLADDFLPESAITSLPRIQVDRIGSLPVSGATKWAAGQWQIILNATEPLTRQRFSLAHEFKHILDHRFIDVLYEQIPRIDRAAYIEQICDYFAGCVLVPRTALKRAWGNGMQHPRRLAAHFGVSEAAMAVRLSQVGLVTHTRRCNRQAPDWFTNQPARRYERAAPALIH